MKALLTHPDRDLDFEHPSNWRSAQEEPKLSPSDADLVQDLELQKLFAAMSNGDQFLFSVARHVVLWSRMTDAEAIAYRQDALRDCLEHAEAIDELYALAVEALQREKKDYLGVYMDSPGLILHRSLRVMEMLVEVLKRLHRTCERHASDFRSDAFTRLFATLFAELDDEYFHAVEDRLRELEFRHGMLISAELGKGNKGTRHLLHKAQKPGWRERFLRDRSSLWFELPERDEAGARALRELSDKGLNLVADALAQSCDHVLSFFRQLRSELAFYIGCRNLHEWLTRNGEPTCFPAPAATGGPALCCQGLYDPCLSLTLGERGIGTPEERTVGNDVGADGKSLVVITGANQGGKSTFLRSVGLAQLMMQSGMFVAAESFHADVRAGVFTHFKREEDRAMESGKLDEELARMSSIVDETGPNSLLLCNESFASTNEREGSEIARQIVQALIEAGAKVFFVTHMFELAHRLHQRGDENTLFLRAERTADGRRIFRMLEGEPSPTSHGEDLYRRIFGTSPDAQLLEREEDFIPTSP